MHSREGYVSDAVPKGASAHVTFLRMSLRHARSGTCINCGTCRSPGRNGLLLQRDELGVTVQTGMNAGVPKPRSALGQQNRCQSAYLRSWWSLRKPCRRQGSPHVGKRLASLGTALYIVAVPS